MIFALFCCEILEGLFSQNSALSHTSIVEYTTPAPHMYIK